MSDVMSSTSTFDFGIFNQSSTPSSAIRYKLFAGLLLLTTLTLYPDPSPLFHLACLPAMILLYRHDRILFYSSISICVAVISIVGHHGGERREYWITWTWLILLRWAIGSASLIGCIHLVRVLVRRLEILRAHGQCLIFGILWTIMSAINRDHSFGGSGVGAPSFPRDTT
jgi:hypothetical protein